MKRSKFFLTIGLIVGLLAGINSCYVVVRKDYGRHRGVYKYPQYRHFPPGQTKFYKKKHYPGKWKKGPIPKNKKR